MFKIIFDNLSLSPIHVQVVTEENIFSVISCERTRFHMNSFYLNEENIDDIV